MTNMPISLSNAQDLYNRLHNASLGRQRRVQAERLRHADPGTSGYQLKLSAVRAWCDAYMS